jgi:hypothetical protein
VELDGMMREHKWSTVSLAISIGAAVTLLCATQYFYRMHGVHDFRWLSPYGGSAVIASVVTGIVAIWKEKGSAASILAVIVGAFSFVFYVV